MDGRPGDRVQTGAGAGLKKGTEKGSVPTNLVSFYIECFRRAFAGWFGRVEGWTGTVSLLLAILFLIFPSATVLEKQAAKLPALMFLLIFGGIIAVRLIASPYWVFRITQQALMQVKADRLPRIDVSLPTPPVINSISLRGSTSESWGGTRQTVITGWEMDVVSLVCVNSGQTQVRACQARLMAALRLSDDGRALEIVEPVELPWSKEDPENNLSIDILPNGKQRLWIGGVRTHGHFWLYREMSKLPLEYQQLIGGPGTYQLLIQIDGNDIPFQQIVLEIVAAEGPKPENGLWRGKAEVRLLNQGAATLQFPSLISAETATS